MEHHALSQIGPQEAETILQIPQRHNAGALSPDLPSSDHKGGAHDHQS